LRRWIKWLLAFILIGIPFGILMMMLIVLSAIDPCPHPHWDHLLRDDPECQAVLQRSGDAAN